MVWTTMETNYNYAPAFLYFLKAIGYVYLFFENPVNLEHYWQANNLLFLTIIKLPVIAADMFTIWGIWYLVSKLKVKNEKVKAVGGKVDMALLAAAYYAFNPFIIFEGSYWGQVGAIGSATLLAGIIWLFEEKPLRAIGIVTLGFLLKLQMMFFVPLLLLWVFKKWGWKKLVASLAVMTGVFFGVSAPFVIAGQMERVVYLIMRSADWFPYMSLNAYNLWWIVTGGNGFGTIDRMWVWGPMTAKTLGLVLFMGCVLCALALMVRKKGNRETLIKAGLWIAFGFFMLPTQMHERYIYPAFLFLALLSCKVFVGRKEKRNLILALIWAVLPVSGFYNLYNVMYLNYPEYSFGFWRVLNNLSLTIGVAWLQLGLFVILSLWLFRELGWKWSGMIVGAIVAILVFKQGSYALASEVSLSSLDPAVYQQGYGVPKKNLAVNSIFGWKQKNFLSSNYYFYGQGWGVHAKSVLDFPIGGGFRRFTTDMGVDTETGEQATVIFKIYGDGKLLFESGKIGRFDFPNHADVDVAGVKILQLVVEDAGDGINQDHADWFNPKLIR